MNNVRPHGISLLTKLRFGNLAVPTDFVLPPPRENYRFPDPFPVQLHESDNFVVHYSKPNYKHENPANSPPLQTTESVMWNEVKQELHYLEELIRSTDEIPDPQENLLTGSSASFSSG